MNPKIIPIPTEINLTLPSHLIKDLCQLIDQTHKSIASSINAGLTMLYWRVGERIHKEILQTERAEYGQNIVVTVSRQLVKDYGNGFTEKNLRRMIQFAEIFPDSEIVVSLIRQLSWTHFIALIPIKDPLKRDFYAEMCRIERWNVKTLRSKISSMLYERTALAKQPETVISKEILKEKLQKAIEYARLRHENKRFLKI